MSATGSPTTASSRTAPTRGVRRRHPSTRTTGRDAFRPRTPRRQAAARSRSRTWRRTPADPEASDYSTGTLPQRSTTPRSRTRPTSTWSSTRATPDYTDDTDYTDDRRRRLRRCGTPATMTPEHGRHDLARRRHWTDVRVKEHNLPSLFGAVGLPLKPESVRERASRSARARAAPFPASRGAQQRDREGSAALLRQCTTPIRRTTISTSLPGHGPGRVRVADGRWNSGGSLSRWGLSVGSEQVLRPLAASSTTVRAAITARRHRSPPRQRRRRDRPEQSLATLLKGREVRRLLPPLLTDPSGTTTPPQLRDPRITLL